MLPASMDKRQSKAHNRNNSIIGHGNFIASPVLDVVMMSMGKTGSSNLLALICAAQGPPCSDRINEPDFKIHVRRDSIK